MMWLLKRNFSKATRQNLNISLEKALHTHTALFSDFRQSFAIQMVPVLWKYSVTIK